MTDLRFAVGASPPWREVTVDGVRLTCDDAGTGPTVVCLHAIGHGAGDFARLGARLREGYRVVALDWPGQGRSARDPVPASAVRYAALLDGFLDAIDAGPVVLIGNSIGGAGAIRYAAAHPERVRGLVLENAGGLAPVDRAARAAIGVMVRFFAAGARGARWFPAAFAAYYRLVLQRPAAAAQRARIVAAAGEVAPVLREAWQSFAAPDSDLRETAGQVACPVLCAWATRDRIVPLGRSLAGIGRFRSARIEKFRAGHAAHLEEPEAFAASVGRFLAELPSTA